MSGRPALTTTTNAASRAPTTKAKPKNKLTAAQRRKRDQKAANALALAEEQKLAYEKEIAALKAQLQTAKDASSASDNQTLSALIPRLKGSHGNGFSLSKYLRQDHGVDKLTYNHMMKTARASAHIARLGGLFSKQDPVRMGQVFVEMRKKFPLLKRFEADWVTAELVKQSLKNWRQAERKGAAAQDDSDAEGEVSQDENNANTD